jgi:hypothetical protein
LSQRPIAYKADSLPLLQPGIECIIGQLNDSLISTELPLIHSSLSSFVAVGNIGGTLGSLRDFLEKIASTLFPYSSWPALNGRGLEPLIVVIALDKL